MTRDAGGIIPVIVGPTASGKSGVGVSLAHRLRGGGGGEIVTADSMQVYRDMDIGTAKPTEAERGGVAHHLIDVAEPTEAFSVERWLGLADRAIDEVRARGGVPIVVGGTHLYIKAFMEGLFDGPAGDPDLRARLASLTRGERRAELERADPGAAARIHVNDDRRTIRALEVLRLTGRPISEHQRQWDAGRARPDGRLVALRWETSELNRRINARVREMVERGLVGEARELWSSGRLGPQAREALGYKQLIDHFEGRMTLVDAVERIKIETRRFAKNQRTWIRRLLTLPGAVSLDAAARTPDQLAGDIEAIIG